MANEIKPKAVKLSFAPGAPVKILDSEQDIGSNFTEAQKTILNEVGNTIKTYLQAAQELLNGRYIALKDIAPLHLSNPGNVLIICCNDGVVIRYEKDGDEGVKILNVLSSDKLSRIAPQISEWVVFCHEDKNFVSSIPTTAPTIQLSVGNTPTGPAKEVLSLRIGFDTVLAKPTEKLPSPPNKPYCLVSVRNSFELGIFAELVPEPANLGHAKRVLARTMFKLLVGWECIEIFPFMDLDYWKPEFAAVWAEKDLLASVVSQQLREQKYRELDPNVAARKEFRALFKAYKELLDSNPDREELLQIFLKENPVLLCPTKLHVWPKLSLGTKKETDFVFREATGEYLLVEIERSTLRLFLKNGDTSRALNHARNQISDWKRYIEDNLSTVQREQGLVGISSNPKSLIVIGRSNSLTPENKRKLVTIENENPKTRIMTYDDVLVNAKAVVENILGPIWETFGNTEVFYLPTNDKSFVRLPNDWLVES